VLLRAQVTGWTFRQSNPGGGSRCSAPVQTSPGAQPASYRMGTGSFPRIKRPGRGVDHQTTSSAEVKETVELYLYSPSGPEEVSFIPRRGTGKTCLDKEVQANCRCGRTNKGRKVDNGQHY
jgi:hypothetical protein